MFGAKPTLTTIQLTGIDDVTKMPIQPSHLKVYGYRVEDSAMRIVGVAVTNADAVAIMSQARYQGKMPQIEVEDRHWFHPMVIGAGVLWEEEKGPHS